MRVARRLIAAWIVLAAGCGPPAPASAPAAGTAETASAIPALESAREQRRRGLDLRRQGRLEDARRALEEALVVFESSGAAAEQAETLNDLAEVLFHLGEFEGLERVEWRALELAEPLGLVPIAATAWNNLGIGYAARGLPSAALVAHGRCLELRRRLGNLAGEAVARHNLGVQLLQLGRLPEGVEELRQAIDLHRRSGGGAELGQSLASWAWGLALSAEWKAAGAAYAEAVAVLAAAGADYDLAVALEQRAQLHRRLGRLDAARADLERSRALAAAGGTVSPFHAAYVDLGHGAVLTDQGDAAEALPFLRRAVAAFDSLGGHEGRVLARLELARGLRAAGPRAEAIPVLEAALEVVESARSDLHLVSLRRTYLEGWQDIYLELVDLLAETALRAKDRDEHRHWAARAFEVAERARARALLDTLASPAPARGPEGTGRAPRGTLRGRVDALEAEVLALGGEASDLGDPEPQAPGVLAAEQRLDRLRRLRFEIEWLAESAASVAELRPLASEPETLGAIQRQLDPGTVLLAYSLGARRSWLWRIDSSEVSVWPLAAGLEIETAARHARQLLPRSEQLGYREAARAARRHLSELVLGPLDGPLPPLVAVVPDGALHLVPLSALSRPSAVNGAGRPLGDEHEVIQLPSASVLVELRRRRLARRPAPRPLAIVADPVFEDDDPRLGAAAAPFPATAERFPGGHLSRLPGTAEEALRIREIAGGVPGWPAVPIYAGFDATRELITGGRLDGFRTLHFASHALVDSRDPAVSGLVVSLYDADGRAHDGLLRARDLYGLGLAADLVVLSACQTAAGTEVRGEGVVGLAEGFFAAGASGLVVSLWEVDDQAAVELMTRFYDHLLRHGRRASEALRLAQRELREETKWSSPAHWAAFVLLGDWETRAA